MSGLLEPPVDGFIHSELVEARKAKDAAYHERNQLVAALARLFPSGIRRTNIPGWDPEWHGCVWIDLPTGQASWHYHDREAALFEGLPAYTKPWDGHTTEEKYRRVANLCPPYIGLRARLSSARRSVLSPDQIEGSESSWGTPARIGDITSRQPGWHSWWVACLECGHSCVAVQHESAKGFAECPACHAMRMVRTAPAE